MRPQFQNGKTSNRLPSGLHPSVSRFLFLSIYLVAIFETLAVLLFVLGLFTRAICVPLIVIILVAIFGVHFENGYSLTNNGFEVPLYYLCMIFVLFSFGGGNISLDKIIFKNDQ